ncbi:possible Uncharacterized secreted proteins, Ya [Prochlorococcus marinus str. MIT 9515]|uniref:Possible Uncharacterized secreted proteins, Ya n=1 Tax=Prochlorococcus marinus (strain MIT 9515) TaxID=167542 RepID=A2BWG8_PROM5|nr:hypothetical protein [Prochlorococcus marinus]ABM72129.1 possible Uncharacterized secreted proteins, Ya [Prochlorococcus marinus str. MIT 9515]
MNYKKKGILLSIFLILIIQILLLINNKQKSSFRYLIWNVEEVSIGRLICISFVSGLLMSSLLNKSINNNFITKRIIDNDDKTTDEDEYLTNKDENNEQYEITPERDIRDPQPTISVNYRVIKNNGENEFKGRNQSINNTQSDDDWNNNGSEW